MNQLKKLDKELVFGLAESSYKTLDSFTLFRKSNVSFPSFSTSLQKLVELEFITVDGYQVTLTEKGKLQSQFIDLRRKDKKRIPNYHVDVPKSQFYIPSIKRLDKVTFAKVLDLLS